MHIMFTESLIKDRKAKNMSIQQMNMLFKKEN